ncbi:Protein-methionine sulfoxide oxidase MICAL2 [Trichinella pseudospiralis]|uniref:Protein-methionine sulfoxide oxidase MICAL2 n=1 Tax=Trichinella pseudospiralis TaxID=6337 RepID=A0A0V1F721_TRIPS|nr:Protein-methionine sulfoxide oxidase MICAL2 [Trichinella pseudospiralis]
MELAENECLWKAMKMFIEASSLETALVAYGQLISLCRVNRSENYKFYASIREKVNWWKVKQLWEMLDKRFTKSEYLNQQAGKDLRVLVVGAGLCGLRLAIECAFLGAKVIVLEKREAFVHNSLLPLRPYAKEDLKNLGANILYPKLSIGYTTNINISSLQLILLKVALLVGIEVHKNVSFCELIEPKLNSDNKTSDWKAALIPENHVLADYQFNVLIYANEEQNTVTGFRYNGQNDYEQVCEYLSKIKQKIKEESSSSFTLVQTLDQTESEELNEEPAHSGIHIAEVSVNASIEELKEMEWSTQTTANDNDKNEKWLTNCERSTMIKADKPLQQTTDSNNTQCISRTSSARKKQQPAFLQKMNKLLRTQWKHYFTKKKSMKNIEKVNNYAADITVVNPVAQHGLQPSTQEIQSIDSCGGQIYDAISKDCSDMRDIVKKTSNAANDNSDKVDKYKESEKEMRPELHQVPQNSQTPPMVIERQVIKTSDPDLVKSINNLLGPLLRQHVAQQKSKMNSKKENIKATDSTLKYPHRHEALQLNTKQLQSDEFISRQICGITSTDCSNLNAISDRTSIVNNKNGGGVDIDKEGEDEMKTKLHPYVDNNQKLPMGMEPRARKPLDPAFLQKMESLLGPIFRQQTAELESEMRLIKKNIKATDSTLKYPHRHEALQLNTKQLQSDEFISRQMCGITSTDCSNLNAISDRTSIVNNKNGGGVDIDKEGEDEMKTKLHPYVDNNQKLPMGMEPRARKPLDPAFLQKMESLLGPIFRQQTAELESEMRLIKKNIKATDSTLKYLHRHEALQLNTKQLQSDEFISRQICGITSTDTEETINDNDEDGGSD